MTAAQRMIGSTPESGLPHRSRTARGAAVLDRTAVVLDRTAVVLEQTAVVLDRTAAATRRKRGEAR